MHSSLFKKEISFFLIFLIFLIFIFFSFIFSGPAPMMASMEKRLVAVFKTGPKTEELSNFTMEGGMPFSPSAMCTNSQIFFFAEPHRFRISAFNRQARFLFEIKNEEFKDVINLYYTKDDKLAVILSESESTIKAYIYQLDKSDLFRPLKKVYARILPKLTSPDKSIYSLEYFSYENIFTVKRADKVLIYSTDGRFIRNALSDIIDNRGNSWLLVKDSKNWLINVYSPEKKALKTIALPFLSDTSAALFRLENDFYVSAYDMDKRDYSYIRVSGDFKITQGLGSGDLPIDPGQKYIMETPYPPGDIKVYEIFSK